MEPDLKLELPVAVSNIAGNADEGGKIITNIEQMNEFHDCQTKIHLADAKYDIKENYLESLSIQKADKILFVAGGFRWGVGDGSLPHLFLSRRIIKVEIRAV